jgi:hypothetical protein
MDGPQPLGIAYTCFPPICNTHLAYRKSPVVICIRDANKTRYPTYSRNITYVANIVISRIRGWESRCAYPRVPAVTHIRDTNKTRYPTYSRNITYVANDYISRIQGWESRCAYPRDPAVIHIRDTFPGHNLAAQKGPKATYL